MDDLYSLVRKLINYQIAIFNGNVSEREAHAFTVLEENAEELEDEGITEDLDKFIKYGRRKHACSKLNKQVDE